MRREAAAGCGVKGHGMRRTDWVSEDCWPRWEIRKGWEVGVLYYMLEVFMNYVVL